MSILDEVTKEISALDNIEIMKAAAFICEHFKILCVGNGGSSSTASHLASDLMNLGYDAVCLTDNVPRLTALTNDYGWGNLYRNMVKNHCHLCGVVVIIISVNGSSGKSGAGENWSQNLYDFAEFVKENKGGVVSLVGNGGGELKNVSDICIKVKSRDPYVVEGIHSVMAHAICDYIREKRVINLKQDNLNRHYCSCCNHYTLQKVGTIQDGEKEFWYCPRCNYRCIREVGGKKNGSI